MRLDGLLVWQLLTWFATRSEGLLQGRDLREHWDPGAKMSTSYDALREVARGLHHVEAAGTNAFASLSITPRDLLSSPSREPASTHVSYNCTSTSAIWNLQQDPNVLRLEHFEASEAAATATIRVADCSNLSSSMDHVVIVNAFFGVEFAGMPAYFYVVNASELERCQVRLELAQATFTQVYPDCKIKFRSTDIANLIGTESHEAAAAMRARRSLETSSFGFVKDSSCKYDCGEEGDAGEIDADKCWAKDADTWIEVQCKVQFYEKNSKCSSECGYEGDNETLAPNQCYECSSSDGSCKLSYSSTDDGCCRVLECGAVEDTAVTSSGTLSWNLDDDTLAVSNSTYPIFETGNCSDTSDPSTDCCRVTCENCFLNVSIASLFADVQVIASPYL
uniref:Uncharacterized protein n=1 Tax=Phytophthora ramorum TaxID=164328 RepID=H3H4Z4_PHYRM